MNPIEKRIDYVVKDEIIEDAEREEMISSARFYYTNMKGKISDKNAELAALRGQVTDVNELLWEFAENPNIELGEKGHSKIEDYFKKYAKQEAQ